MNDTFGHRLRAYMQAEQSRLGVAALTPEQWVKCANAYHSADAATTRMLKTKVKQPRTQLFMALCQACAIDYAKCTKTQVKGINQCLTELRDVCPELVPDEITHRAKIYKQKHPTWELTPRALVKNWGTLFNGTTLPSKVDEPAGWRERIDELFTPDEREASPATIEFLRKNEWSRMTRDRQQGIIRRMQKLTQAQPELGKVSAAYFGD